MSERLKQIWSGFSAATTRPLTGSGVDHIETPRRADWTAREHDFLPADFTAPADVAFAALKTQLSGAERKAQARAERRRNSKSGRGFSAAPPAPLSGEASFEGAPQAAVDMIRGLRATEARTFRLDADYAEFIAANPKAAPKAARRKRFGIF